MTVFIVIYSFGTRHHFFFIFFLYFTFPPGMIILIPLHATADGGQSGVDATSLSNVSSGSNRMFAHLILGYVFTFAALYVIREAAFTWLRFRVRYMTMAQPHHHTVFVTNVPENHRSPKQVKNKFDHLYSDVCEVSVVFVYI